MPAEGTTQEGGAAASGPGVPDGGDAGPRTGRDQSAPVRVDTAEGRFAYHARGGLEGRPPLVLLHGFTGHRDDFIGVMPALARQRRVIAPDLRGHGDSEPGPGRGGYGLDQLAADLLALLDALDLARVDLLGHSVGGLVAQRFAFAHPDRLRSLTLLCTGPAPPQGLDPEGWRRACTLAERSGMAGLQRRSEERARARPSPGLAAWSDPERYFLHQRRRFAAMTPASYRGVGGAFFGAESVVARLESIRLPTLVLVGALDQDWLEGAAELAAGIPGARRVVVPGAEHHPHQERAGIFLAEVEAHLGRVDALGGPPTQRRSSAGRRRSESSITQNTDRSDPEEESSMSGKTQDVQIPTRDGGTMGAYLALPEGSGPAPAVVVWMEIFGVNDHIRDVTRRVAAEGYVALAPDFFHRTGPGLNLGYDEAGFEEGFKHLNQLKADQMIADARDAIAWLRDRDDVVGDRIGAMGFCIGGHMTYLTACETDVIAAASYYGGGIAAPQGPGGGPSTLSRTGGIRGRIACYFGGQDSMIPSDQVEAIEAALAEHGIDHEVHVYADADHGFHCDQRGTYHEASAKDAWEKTKALFESTLRA